MERGPNFSAVSFNFRTYLEEFNVVEKTLHKFNTAVDMIH
jgi:hypothetical protein